MAESESEIDHETYRRCMQAFGAPMVTDFSAVTVHWRASPFPNLVTLIHSKLAEPKTMKHISMSVAEAEELAGLLRGAAEHARAYWKENGVGPYY